jgi:hypothetical protein
MNILAAAAYVQLRSTMSSASLKRARGVKAALAWDTKASWSVKRFLDSSTSPPEAFPVTQAHRYRTGQPPWTSQLTVYSGEWWHFDGPGADLPRPILDVPLK